MSDKSITQITLDKLREAWEAPFRARVTVLENALRDANIGHADNCRCVGCALVFAPAKVCEHRRRWKEDESVCAECGVKP